MEQELEKISGTVEDVTYHNEESGFTVLLVDVDGDPVTVVGEVPEDAVVISGPVGGGSHTALVVGPDDPQLEKVRAGGSYTFTARR